MEELQQKFFNSEEPCPSEITNCEEIRAMYLEELNKYKASGMCNSCIEQSLRKKYLMLLKNQQPQATNL
jgi:hypothetical protein